jgi:hypothetical protein
MASLMRPRSIAAAACLAWALLMGGATCADDASGAPQPLAEWKGEYFDKKQGGLFVRVGLKGFKASKQTKFITGNAQIVVYNILKKKSYTVSHRLAGLDGAPSELWKLPAGKYEVREIALVDTAGVRRTWRSKDNKGERRTFIVKRQSLSNLGVWVVSPSGRDDLEVKFTMVPSTYKEGGSRSDSTVRAVVNGFTGLEQEIFGGKGAGSGAEGNQREMRATVTITRQIAMFYKLDLFRFNNHARSIASVLALSDTNLRTCFTNRLEWNESLRGDVKFTFLLSKSSGTMTKLKHTGGTANDAKLVECMYFELAQIQFPVPENMIGELTYTFDVR